MVTRCPIVTYGLTGTGNGGLLLAMERSQKMAMVAVGVAVLLLAISIRYVFFSSRPQPPTPQEAVKILLTSKKEPIRIEAVHVLQDQGADALPQCQEIYTKAANEVERSMALGIIRMMPPSNNVVAAWIELINGDLRDAVKKDYALRLTRCTGQFFGTDGSAWRAWWEREGKYIKAFDPNQHAPATAPELVLPLLNGEQPKARP